MTLLLKRKWRVVSVMLAVLVALCSLSIESVAETNDELSDRGNETSDPEGAVPDSKPLYLQEIEEKRKEYDTFEIVSLRESNVKHFALADGTYQAVVYPNDVHEMDAAGQWVERSSMGEYGNTSSSPDSRSSGTTSNRSVACWEDTYIDASFPASNYGSVTNLYVGTTQTAYFKFHMPDLPAAATINDATFNFSYCYTITSGYLIASLYQVVRSWEVNTLTYSNAGSDLCLSSNALTDIRLFAGTDATTSSPKSQSINIRYLVEGWYEGVPNYGLAIRRKGGTNNSVIIKSVENIGAYWPIITIYYTIDDLPVDNGTYVFENAGLKNFMQINDDCDFSTEGATIELFGYNHDNHHTNNGEEYQRWNLVYLHNGYYKILGAKSGKALSVQSGKENMQNDFSWIIQETYSALARQQWQITATMDGRYAIRPRSSQSYPLHDYCLAAGDSLIEISTDGRNVEQRIFIDDEKLKDEWFLFRIDSGDVFLLGITDNSSGHDHSTVFGLILNDLLDYNYNSVNLQTTDYISVNDCKMNMAASEIVVIRGHGGSDSAGTYMVLSNTGQASYLGTSQIYDYQLNQAQVDLSNVDVVLFVGCYTANHLTTSILDAAVAAGAHYAIGFSDTIVCAAANAFVESFFDFYSNGHSIEESCELAKIANTGPNGISSCVLDFNY